MSYYIKQQFISMNRPKEPFIKLKGIIIHSTANISATSLNHFNYWNNADRQSSVHFMADWVGEEIYQFIPENEIAWHVGNWQANREWLGIEMCETNDPVQFDIVWKKTVWLVADVCIRHGWNVDDNVWSHNGMRSLYKGVDHTDPYGYLQRMGRTWKQLMDDINKEIARRKQPQPSPAPVQTQEVNKKLSEPYQIPTGSNIIPLGNYGWIESLEGRVIIHADKYSYISIEDGSIYAYAKGKDAVKII